MKAILSILFCSLVIFCQAQTCVPNSNSLLFDGTSSFVDMGAASNIENLTAAVTIEAWIFANSWGFNSAQNSILCTHGWASGEKGMVLRAGDSGILSFNIAGLDQFSVPTSWQEVVSPANSMQLNTWTHVAGTFSGTELKVYVNGNEVGSLLFNGSIVPSSYGVKVGKLADDTQSPGRYFSGNIDEVRVWNRALTSSEIMASASMHIDPLSASGLVSYWRFNEGSGVSAADLGFDSYVGLIQNASWSTSVPFNEAPPVPIIGWNGSTLISSSIQNNQWYLGANLINGAQGSTYAPTQNGSYTVVVTDPGGCSSSSQPYIVTTVGIESIASITSPGVWPNPTKDILNVQSDLLFNRAAEIFIYDMNQRLVKHERFENFSEKNISINCSGFSEGIYRLYMQSEKTNSNIKFVVAR